MRLLLLVLGFVLALCAVGPVDAQAEDEPATTEETAAAQTTAAIPAAATDAVETVSPDQAAEAAEAAETTEAAAETEAAKPKAEVSLVAEAGGVALAGNTRSFTANGAINFGVKRDKNKFSLGVGANWGRSYIKAADGTGAWATTATRIFGTLRYDRFLTERNSLFIFGGAFTDRFAGKDLSVEANIGYSHLLVKTEKHQLTGEAGFNYTYEDYVAGVDPNTQHFLGGRLFLGYALKANDSVGVTASVESLLGGRDNKDAPFDGRLNAAAGLNAALSKALAVKLGFLLGWDFAPPVGFLPVDTTVSVGLVATLL